MNEFGNVYENISLKDYTTFKIGGVCKYLIKPYDALCLQKLIKYLKTSNLKYFILGNGSNVILDDSYFDGVVICFDNLQNIIFEDNKVIVQSGVKLPYLVQKCLEKGYTSLAFASMIPGCVGGSIAGNAGCYGSEIMDSVLQVTVLDKNGDFKTLTRQDISFGYRYTSLKDNYIIESATLALTKGDLFETKKWIEEINIKRKNTQPIDQKCVGSIFRNPENASAGKLIDDLGLKNMKIGGASISDKHANFIVNDNNASFSDVISLIDLIKSEVKKAYYIDLITEPVIIKWNEL